MAVKVLTLATLLIAPSSCSGFLPIAVGKSPHLKSSLRAENGSIEAINRADSSIDPHAIKLKDDLIALADKTRRGFSASRAERNGMKRIVDELSKYSPTDEPAAAYYEDTTSNYGSSLSGKWTLIYTDAPDITSLEGGPLSPSKLGKIGQECSPPYIKNVIEWKRPDWASSLPFSGSEGDRVLQKVCCKGFAVKSKPTTVDLKLVGLELTGAAENVGETLDNSKGGPAALFAMIPVELEGPLSLTFGKFDVLYLDDDMRITRTYQGFTAINIRENEWF